MMAIDPYIDQNIILPTEKVVTAKNMVQWGDKNLYPHYLLTLYKNVATLASIINGNVDYICGNDITLGVQVNDMELGVLDKKGNTIREQVRDLALSYELYGGFALQIIRNRLGEIAEIHAIDLRFLRWNEDADVFYYSEKWDKGGRVNPITYPAYQKNLDWASLDDSARERNASSILLVKNTRSQVYPLPIYASAVKACEIEKNIDNFHLNSLENNFVSSLIINFNNGEPNDQQKEEIEDEVNEKFSGHQNAGRIMLCWNKDRTSATTITEPQVHDFGARYDALAKHSRQQIFSAFRAVPALFGINPENTGFSETEYNEAFKLYNRTMIQPIQRTIIETYEKLLGAGVLTIVPFSLTSDTEKNVQ